MKLRFPFLLMLTRLSRMMGILRLMHRGWLKMKVQLMSTMWGETHVDWWIKGTLRSLALPENKKALQSIDSHWNIFTETKYFHKVTEALSKYMPVSSFELMSTEKLRDRIDNLHSALIWQVRKCVDEHSRFLFAPPDTIFGDGTIEALFAIGKEPETCVAVAHPRVEPSILDERLGTNEELVDLAWKHLHRSWTEAEDGHPRQHSFEGGVSWRRLAPHVVAVTHRLPTIYFAHFTPGDLKYFERNIGFGVYDHTWPGDVVMERKPMFDPNGRLLDIRIENQRQRYVGSSDAAFIVEVTDREKNIPRVVLQGDPQKYWKNDFHNNVNRQVSVIWRGSSL